MTLKARNRHRIIATRAIENIALIDRDIEETLKKVKNLIIRCDDLTRRVKLIMLMQELNNMKQLIKCIGHIDFNTAKRRKRINNIYNIVKNNSVEIQRFIEILSDIDMMTSLRDIKEIKEYFENISIKAFYDIDRQYQEIIDL